MDGSTFVGYVVLWPFYLSLGHHVSWLLALPSVALCLFWFQLEFFLPQGHRRWRLAWLPGLYLGFAVSLAADYALLCAGVYLAALGLPVWLGQRYWQCHYQRRVAAETAHRRAVVQAADQRATSQARAEYGAIADQHEAAGRWREAALALRQLQSYDWNDPELRARIERLEARAAAGRGARQ